MRADVLLRAAEVFGGVDRQPEPNVAERTQLPLGGELGEGGRLVISPLRKTRERVFAEHVDAAADPAFDRAALGESANAVAVELDDAEGRPRLRDRDRRRGAGRAVVLE